MTTDHASQPSLRAVLLGCGDLGIRAGTTLAALGHHVTGVRRNVTQLPEQFDGVAADLATDALPDLPADRLVIALAPDQRDEQGYRHTYVAAMRRGLEAVLASGTPRRAVLVSSTSVYGDLTGDLDETTALEPNTERGRILLEAEALFHELVPHGSVLRLSGLYGTPGNRLVRQVQAGDNKDPGRWTNRMHRDDAAAAMVHLLLREEAPEPLYVGTDDEPCTAGEVRDFVADALGIDRPAPTGITEPTGRRMRNARLRASGLELRYPSYREGYLAQLTLDGLT